MNLEMKATHSTWIYNIRFKGMLLILTSLIIIDVIIHLVHLAYERVYLSL